MNDFSSLNVLVYRSEGVYDSIGYLFADRYTSDAISRLPDITRLLKTRVKLVRLDSEPYTVLNSGECPNKHTPMH